MKGKDPRDAHFITSRICGICGDNHAACAVYAQNMAFGVKPPPLADWIINLGEAAEYMFDHNLFQDNLVGVDFCEQMVRETNPRCGEGGEGQRPAHPRLPHDRRHHAPLNLSRGPSQGSPPDEPSTREMFCLMEGLRPSVDPLSRRRGHRAVRPAFNDYLVRPKYADFVKRAVPLHDDLFDFFYEALPGYEEVGKRRILLGCWGSFQNPEACDFKYETMSRWGREMYVSPGIVVDGKLLTTDLVEINLGIRILLGSSFYDDWADREVFVKTDPLGNPVDRRHPWNQTTLPRPQKRDFGRTTPGRCRPAGSTRARGSTSARHRRRPSPASG
jgi:hydrogenase large subunit